MGCSSCKQKKEATVDFKSVNELAGGNATKNSDGSPRIAFKVFSAVSIILLSPLIVLLVIYIAIHAILMEKNTFDSGSIASKLSSVLGKKSVDKNYKTDVNQYSVEETE